MLFIYILDRSIQCSTNVTKLHNVQIILNVYFYRCMSDALCVSVVCVLSAWEAVYVYYCVACLSFSWIFNKC